MYSNINLQLVSVLCPDGMNKQNCPVRRYIASKSDLFNMSANEDMFTLAKPYDDARGKYEGALFDIYNLCQNCQKRSK